MYEDVFCECVFRGRLWYSRYAAEILSEGLYFEIDVIFVVM